MYKRIMAFTLTAAMTLPPVTAAVRPHDPLAEAAPVR